MFPSVRFALCVFLSMASPAHALCPYDPDCLDNPHGAGNAYSPRKIYVVPSR